MGCDEVKDLQILLALAVNIDPTHNPMYRSLPEVLQEKEDRLSREQGMICDGEKTRVEESP